MNTKDYISSGILEAYLLGALTPAEEAQVEANIALYPELALELQALEAAMLRLAEAQAIAPPPAMQDKIWDAIQSSTAHNAGNGQERPVSTHKTIPFQPEYRKPMPWKYAALWIALVGSAVANLLFMVHTRQEKEDKVALQSKMDTLQNQQNILAAQLVDYTKARDMMADTAMQTIVMHTVVQGHPMAATLYWSKNKGEAYVAMEALPHPPQGMQYQLWAIQGGKPVSMGVLPNSMANTPEIQKVAQAVTSGEAFAISLEKEGGSPTPTMQNIYVMGKSS